MAFNSDGYIMIDFTDVDFRRTNQTIEGLYKRCVDVIGTNKFILVINANGRTPLPATCSFTNNQYVIDTVIYMFAVSSNDNLFIRRNDVPASDIIDDSSISVDKTWSSNKIDSELDTKADTSALADYQPLLTPGTNITIDENNVISSTGGAVIDDSVIVNNKVWSSLNTVEKLAPIDTIVSNPAVFNTSLALPLVECSTSFAATQEGTGDPSPSNVRPIVGVDDITLTVNGDSVVIDLDGTRYGGTVDVVKGVAHITHLTYTIPTANMFIEWYNRHTVVVKPPNIIRTIQTALNVYGDVLKATSITTDNFACWHRYDNVIIIVPDNYTVADFNNNIAGTNIIYPLETPLDIQLSDIPTLSTIIGNNSYASDGDSLKVSYKALPIDLL